MTGFQKDLLIETWALCDEHFMITEVMLAYMEARTGLSAEVIVVYLSSAAAYEDREQWRNRQKMQGDDDVLPGINPN